MNYSYYDTNTKKAGNDINAIFPGFGENEVLAVMSPHDDDAVIGAGYAMLAAREAGAEVYVVIFCRGDAGYSTVEEKATIEAVRERETFDCYERLGIPRDHILRMHFPDFSAISHVGWELSTGKAGDMPVILRFLREKRVTRVMIPNHYHEHIDHLAAYLMSSFDVPQSGDAALVDYGVPHGVRSTLQYSVWADLDPEDALVNGRASNLRANRILLADKSVEEAIDRAIEAYVSQTEIIKSLIEARKERQTKDGRFIEVYISFECRPKMNFKPYIDWIENLSERDCG